MKVKRILAWNNLPLFWSNRDHRDRYIKLSKRMNQVEYGTPLIRINFPMRNMSCGLIFLCAWSVWLYLMHLANHRQNNLRLCINISVRCLTRFRVQNWKTYYTVYIPMYIVHHGSISSVVEFQRWHGTLQYLKPKCDNVKIL